MHYNQGWARGFHDGIRYWEFWNEPDGLFWSGTPQQFYALYEKTARALKSVDPTLKVGGDGKAFPLTTEATAKDFSIIAPRIKSRSIFIPGIRMPTVRQILTTQFASRKKFARILDTHRFSSRREHSLRMEFERGLYRGRKGRTPGRAQRRVHRRRAQLSSGHLRSTTPTSIAEMRRGWGSSVSTASITKPPTRSKRWVKMLDTPQRLAVEGTDTFGFGCACRPLRRRQHGPGSDQ